MGDPNRILTSANAPLAVTNIVGTYGLQQQLQGVPLGTSDGTATGELGVKVLLAGSGSGGSITVVPKGAANYANGQVAASTSAATLVAARATRRSVTIKNTDGAITVYIGAATVTAANGVPLKAGESIAVDTTALIQVIAASGTPSVAYMETYD